MTEDLLRTIRTRREEAEDAERPHRERAEEDLRFAVGDQWPEEERIEREEEGRPCLTINAMPQFIRQVTGQVRSLNPAIRVIPADGEARKETAEIVEGLIRHIEYVSDASSVYEGATENAAACSMGFWRILTEYCEGATFDQEIRIKRIHNPLAVLFDPFAKEPTRSDARYAFVIDKMPKEVFEEAYPDASVVDFTTDHRFDHMEYWGSTEGVVVAEYFWVEFDEYEIMQLPSGQIIRGPFPKELKGRKRTVQEPKVKWAKTNGVDILEGPMDFPSRYIPIVAVTGEEWHLGEETYRSSVIRWAKDPQVLFNYARSTQAEIASLQPKAPFMITADQIFGYEPIWATANKANRPYLPYNADPQAGAPSRVQPPVSSEAMMTEAQMASEDMKRTTGIYDASLGAKSNETSGRAILARKEESQNATSIYADNMVKAVAHTGRILTDMIPKVYDTKRTIRILGEDGQEKMETINALFMAQDGPMPYNDMKVGKYDIRIQVGPSYNTKREESRDGMMEFLRVNPAAAPLVSDLIAKSQDWPDSDRFAERLRKALPPGVAEDEQEEMTPEQAMMKQQAMQAQQQQMQAQQAAEQIAMREAEAKAVKAEADAVKAQAEAQKAQIEAAAMSGQISRMMDDQARVLMAGVDAVTRPVGMPPQGAM
jgi:hypothetical protein